MIDAIIWGVLAFVGLYSLADILMETVTNTLKGEKNDEPHERK